MTIFKDFDHLEVIAPNFKRRLSGVTSTIIQLIPAQRALGLNIAVFGEGLPTELPRIAYRDLWRLWKRPVSGKKRVWHARRNVEMLAGIVMRDILRMPLLVLFTSASQRQHKAYTKWLIRRMDGVVATSAKTGSYLEVPHSVILHGIDTERFSPPADKNEAKRAVGLPDDKNIVGCFGRIRAQKGSDLFIYAMIEALKEHPSWIAILAGRATAEHQEFLSQMKRTISDAGMQERINFVGEHTDIERWYQAIDLFIAPQKWEGFGLTPIEAMATGSPVIATDVGAFSELIVEDETGYILSDFEPNTLTEQTLKLIKNNRLRTKLGKNARAHMLANFALEKEAKSLCDIYRDLMTKDAD